MKRLRKTAIIYAVGMLTLLAVGVFLLFEGQKSSREPMLSYHDALEEIDERYEGSISDEQMQDIYTAATDLVNESVNDVMAGQRRIAFILFAVWLGLLCAGLIFLYGFYKNEVAPFEELTQLTQEIAKGNLDVALPIHRGNLFGAFTENFDMMREELRSAKERENEALKAKRELVAELSHDIKTPIATIRAACELLSVKYKETEITDKLRVIDDKAKSIQERVDNLFHATLGELEVLDCTAVEEDASYISEYIKGLRYYGSITEENELVPCLIYMDKLRTEQVIDNIIQNAYKYAEGKVSVSYDTRADGVLVRIRDFGEGVAEDELTLVAEKFYRGSNAENKQGSGLGLYLAKWFMERQNGGLYYYNDNGFVVELFFKKV